MKTSPQPYLRSFLFGLAGFVLGGIISAAATYFLFASRLPERILGLLPPEQTFIRLLAGILLIFIGVGVGGAVGGLARGYALSQVDPGGSPRRYLLGGGFSTGISQGILLVPILLVISLVSLYNDGAERDLTFYLAWFTALGGLFGFLNGGLLSLITLRLRYALLAWLGYFLSSLAGGALFGLVTYYWKSIANPVPGNLLTLLFLVLAGIAIYGVPGGVTGLVYAWLSRKRIPDQPVQLAPRRWQDILVVTVGTLVFLSVASFIKQVADFVTVYPGSVTTNLPAVTEGVHWSLPHGVSTDISSSPGSIVGLAVGSQQITLTWPSSTDEILLASQHPGQNANLWSSPISVSKSLAGSSVHPQVALSPDGTAYVVWSDNGEVWYNQCQAASCGDPVSLSQGEGVCSQSTSQPQDDFPVIALNHDGTTLVAWQSTGGNVGYASWQISAGPGARTSGCLSSSLTSATPRLAAGSAREYWLILSADPGSAGDITRMNYRQASWSASQKVGQGTSAELYSDPSGAVHAAWCGTNNELVYLSPDGVVQQVKGAVCSRRPSIFEDYMGLIHLVFPSDQWTDNFGGIRTGNALMETILLYSGWSQPSLVGPLTAGVQPEAASFTGGDAQLVWADVISGTQTLQYASQPAYQCDTSTVNNTMRSIIEVVQNGEFHPHGYKSPFCGNHFDEIIFTPMPPPQVYTLPPGERTGYDQLADLVKSAHYEILFSNMQWDQDQNNLSPGSEMARTITDLYNQVKANPSSYPRGLSIKILLGNYPNMSTLTAGDQIWNVLQDFADAGLPTMEDPSIGWKVELANYKGSFPHSHTKFVVIDGKTVMAAGFNIAWLHLPAENPSGKGDDLVDLGITLTGPVAQTGIAAFDDEWQDSNQVVCTSFYGGDLAQLKANCTWKLASTSHPPESLKYYLSGDNADAVALYRTAVYKESDTAYEVALASAHNTIDVIHVNYTAELICDLNLIVHDICTFDNALPYMHSIFDAMEKNGANVRIMFEGSAGNGMENLSNIYIVQQEAAKRGLLDHLQMRVFNGRVHAKSVMIDDQLLIIGSQNFHYSSIYEGGVAEFIAATDDPDALAVYKEMFESDWQNAIPLEDWKISGH